MKWPANSNKNYFLRNSGFTYIELLVVITILGIFTALLLPRISGRLSEESLDSVVRDFMSVTRYAGSRARSQGNPVKLVINSIEKSYWLEYEQQNEKHLFKQLPYQISIKSSFPNVVFYPDGSLDPAEITFEDSNKNSRKVTSKDFFGDFRLAA